MRNLTLSAATKSELEAVAIALLWEGEDIAADAIYAALKRCEREAKLTLVHSID